MELSQLRGVYEREGPFVTVYLEGRSPAEDAEQQLRLRWQGLRDRLEGKGATAAALDAAESALAEPEPGQQQADGRVLAASESGVAFDEPWDAALGAGDAAHWAHLPELGAYVRDRERSVRLAVGIIDRTGARVRPKSSPSNTSRSRSTCPMWRDQPLRARTSRAVARCPTSRTSDAPRKPCSATPRTSPNTCARSCAGSARTWSCWPARPRGGQR